MQRRGLAPALIGPAQRLPVEGDDAFQRPGQGPGELGEGRLERFRLDQPEHPAEGVVAGRTMLQFQHLAQAAELRPGKQGHVRAVLRPAQHRRQGHEHQLQKIVPRVARPRIANLPKAA